MAESGDGVVNSRSDGDGRGDERDTGGGSGAGGRTRGLSRDELFDLLSNRRRRYALYHLQYGPDETTIGALAEQIAAWEHDTTTEAVTSRQRKLAYNSLQQRHLPRLADHGAVAYDARAGTVRLTRRGEAIDLYLDSSPSSTPATPRRAGYLLLAAAGSLLSLALFVGVSPFAAVEPATWLLLLSVALAVVTAADARRRLDRGAGRDGAPPEVERERP